MRKKRYFTVAEANAMLPLVRKIVEDITTLARQLQDRHNRLMHVLPEGRAAGDAHREELLHVEAELRQDQERMQDYERELHELGVELKDYRIGLIDFPCWMGNREVYLCWRQGESAIAHWHELDAGFAGRQELLAEATTPR
jgi:hypothetical protein